MKIDKNIPVPKKYPFREMEVGDSFIADEWSAIATTCRAYQAAKQYGYRSGKKFAGRPVEGCAGQIRIWRTA